MRVLVAGLGAIGQRHARNLRALLGTGVELIAYRRRGHAHVITESLTRDDSRSVEEALGITRYDDLGAALAARPDAAFVCTPSSGHLEIAQRAADAGCHLFIEKPVSHTLEGLARLEATVAERKLVALVGCQWRFHPCVRALKDLLPRLGAFVRAEIEYAEYLPHWHPYEDYRSSYAARAELGGGVVLTQIHDYDLAYWLFGPPREVRATGGRLSELEIDVEDTVDATLTTAAGDVRIRQTFAGKPPRRTIVVHGSLGSATLDLLAGRLTVEPAELADGLVVADYQRNQLFMDEAAHFIDCVAGRAAPLTPLAQGVFVLKVALAVKGAMRTGATVHIT